MDALIKSVRAFEERQFAHLIGLHKLKDLPIGQSSYRSLFQMINSGKLSYDDVRKSIYFDEIKDRLLLISVLEQIFDSNELIIKYKKGRTKGTIIDAEYIIINKHDNIMLHYFLQQEKDGKYVGVSFFGRDDDKYIRGQQTFKVLKKVKINVKTGTKSVLMQKIE